ncbi:MAG: hypothetical protein JWP12_2560 [Bacteroidetes bacterium]|nr:hypothetical protein [Bacteroidota bacterium]
MKRNILFLFLMAGLFSNAQNISIETLRKDYYKLNTDSATCTKLYNKLSKNNSTDNLINGYKGAITASMANHVKNKEEKIKLFTAGKKLIEQSIKSDSANVELRFLRFTIQTNCPKALGYYKQIDPDKKYIISHFASLKNTDLRHKIAEYLLSTSYVNADEKKKIKSAAN